MASSGTHWRVPPISVRFHFFGALQLKSAIMEWMCSSSENISAPASALWRVSLAQACATGLATGRRLGTRKGGCILHRDCRVSNRQSLPNFPLWLFNLTTSSKILESRICSSRLTPNRGWGQCWTPIHMLRTRRAIYLVGGPRRSDHGATITGNPGNIG